MEKFYGLLKSIGLEGKQASSNYFFNGEELPFDNFNDIPTSIREIQGWYIKVSYYTDIIWSIKYLTSSLLGYGFPKESYDTLGIRGEMRDERFEDKLDEIPPPTFTLFIDVESESFQRKISSPEILANIEQLIKEKLSEYFPYAQIVFSYPSFSEIVKDLTHNEAWKVLRSTAKCLTHFTTPWCTACISEGYSGRFLFIVKLDKERKPLEVVKLYEERLVKGGNTKYSSPDIGLCDRCATKITHIIHQYENNGLLVKDGNPEEWDPDLGEKGIDWIDYSEELSVLRTLIGEGNKELIGKKLLKIMYAIDEAFIDIEMQSDDSLPFLRNGFSMLFESLPRRIIEIPLEDIMREFMEDDKAIKLYKAYHGERSREGVALEQKSAELFTGDYAESGYSVEDGIVQFVGIPRSDPRLDFTQGYDLENDSDLTQLFFTLGDILKDVYNQTLGIYSEPFSHILAAIITEYDTEVREMYTDYSDIEDLYALREHYKQVYNVKPSYTVSSTFCTKCRAKSGEEFTICPSCGKEKLR